MDEPRQRLIEAGLDLFGKYSFDGASTRMLAERAEVNLAAIKYYFGGKEGLYLAVADEIVEQVDGLLGPQLAKIRQALQHQSVSRERSFNLLCELLEFLITRFLGLPESNKWLSILVREELCPTEAFDIFFEGFMRPLQEVLFDVVARIMGVEQDNREVKLRVFAIMGQIFVFHLSPSGIQRTLKWKDYGPENLDAIRGIVLDNVKGIFAMSENASGSGSGTRSMC